MAAWCRACGQAQPSQVGDCTACGVELSLDGPSESPIGLAYQVRGKLGLGHRQGVCLDVDGTSLLVHVSAKDKEPTRVPVSAAPSALIPAGYSSAARLLHAADLDDAKLSWDRELIRDRVPDLCTDVRMRRRVADEALQLQWTHIREWVPLSASEKAWRTAHFAAAKGDEELLLASLSTLPRDGYAARAELLVPHLGMLRRNRQAWLPLLSTMAAAGVPNAADVLAAAIGSWPEAVRGCQAFLPNDSRQTWAEIERELSAGTAVSRPTSRETPAWRAASLIAGSGPVGSLDDAVEQLVGVEPALLDDLVDQSRLTANAALTALPDGLRLYLSARLDPSRLDDAEIRAVEHFAELARRMFLTRDRATLLGIEPTDRVRHYQALLDVVDGGKPDPDRLDPTTVAVLEGPATLLGQIKDGSLRRLTPEIVADPSLWTVFSQLAVEGKILPDPSLPADHPFNTWIGLLRLTGLIWEGQLDAAVEQGKLLAPHLEADEQKQDEALSLTAYALYQLSRVDEALSTLERAVRGGYTEDLLVNASIVASHARPEIGVQYLARLVAEAPTSELQRAALRQALTVWQSTDLSFPPSLVPALRTVLSTPQPIAEYLRFGVIATTVAPGIVSSLPNLRGELDGPYRLLQIRGRWKIDDDLQLGGLARLYIELYKSVGRVEWFMDDWKTWVTTIRESVYVDFGEAALSAQFIDQVLTNAPDLFTPEERFELAPQAGTHMAFAFRAESSSTLTDAAVTKFYLRPMDEFLATRDKISSTQVDYLSDNFALCAGLGALNLYEVQRPQIADEYNVLLERLRWDQQNQYAIKTQMGATAHRALSGPIPTIDRVVERLRRINAGEPERQSLVKDLADGVAEWRSECERLLRSL